MSDEARDAYLQRLDDCAKETDYETWLEGRVALLEAELAKYHSDWGMGPALLLSNLATLQNQLSVAMSENQRLTKYVADYEEENAMLKQEIAGLNHLIDRVYELLTAEEQGDE